MTRSVIVVRTSDLQFLPPIPRALRQNLLRDKDTFRRACYEKRQVKLTIPNKDGVIGQHPNSAAGIAQWKTLARTHRLQWHGFNQTQVLLFPLLHLKKEAEDAIISKAECVPRPVHQALEPCGREDRGSTRHLCIGRRRPKRPKPKRMKRL